MIDAIIIDDEPNACDLLHKLLTDYCPTVRVVDIASDVDEAYLKIEEKNPQLLFLDIQMPNQLGFSLIERFPDPKFVVIFVTAFEEYAITALRKRAIDYILKPINLDDLKNAVKHAEIRLAEIKLFDIAQLVPNKAEPQRPNHITISNINEVHIVQFENIIRIESDGNYSKFILKQGKDLIASKKIGDFEPQMPEDMFCRIHHGHIINLREVKQYIKGRGGNVILSNREKITVSNNKKEEFLAKLFPK